MGFVKNERLKVGDTVILQCEHSSCSGTFLPGSKVIIIGESPRGYDIKDDDGHVMYECSWPL